MRFNVVRDEHWRNIDNSIQTGNANLPVSARPRRGLKHSERPRRPRLFRRWATKFAEM